MPMQAKHGTLNVHRADCDRKHANPCDPWPVRLPRLVKFLSTRMRCSTYSFQECLPAQASDITTLLGWGSHKNPGFWGDENFNVIAADRKKWTDLQVAEVSLLLKVGDKGDTNRRSANWVQLRHLDSGRDVWFGSGHFENGDPAARRVQAGRYVATKPQGPVVAGLDKNSFSGSAGDPRDILTRGGFREVAVATQERSFHGFAKPVLDGKCIDSLHVTGGVKVRFGEFHSTAGLGATDHSGLAVGWSL